MSHRRNDMHFHHRRIAFLFVATLLASTATGQAAEGERREATITVSGEGESSLAPDMAFITLAVVKDAPTARGALDANNKAMADVLKALRENENIADRDLQTAGFSIAPQYRYPDNSDGGNRPPELYGYQVTNGLSIRVRDLSKLGGILDRAVTLGVNQGGNINFSNDTPDEAITAARKEAVANAMAKAKVLTEAAGVSLGRIIEISERNLQAQPMSMRMMAKDSAAEGIPVAAGENGYSVSVEITFSIKQN
ncbi:SIMPL domain-containing protein [Ensifer soli]|uniref:SIMPL domain-containing protein n=1 Tax=Ciceribacter sp. sgz301302 TaxID=3342379 RepID=UPI0035B9ACCF